MGLIASLIAFVSFYASGISPAGLILNWGQQTQENVQNELKTPALNQPESPVHNAPESKIAGQPNDTLLKPISKIAELEQGIHEWTNHYRKQHGLKMLSFNVELGDIARAHSQDMAASNYFSHTNLRGEEPTQRAERANFHCNIYLGNFWYLKGISENIWQGWTYSYTVGGVPGGFSTMDQLAQTAVDDWMNSPGHRKNILTEFWESEGIGVAITEEGKVYATQNFC